MWSSQAGLAKNMQDSWLLLDSCQQDTCFSVCVYVCNLKV